MNLNSLCYSCFNPIPIPGKQCSACGYVFHPEQVKRNCLMPGTVLNNRYLVGVSLGVGGFGITYKCFDTQVGGICAVKEYFPNSFASRQNQAKTVNVDPENYQRYGHIMNRFVEESQMLKTLDHPNIIRTFDSFTENNTAYYVMEYCDGIDLRSYTKNFREKLDYTKGFHFLRQVMEGLEYIHGKNIMHRDVSPDNIYVTKNNSVKILDFGAARREMDQDKRQLSTIVKMGYAPIEQYGSRGKQGPFTDIYALGATFYHLFTGVIPSESTTRAASDRDDLVPISQLRPDLPVNFLNCIERCLTISANSRIQNIQEMKRCLGISYSPQSENPHTHNKSYQTSQRISRGEEQQLQPQPRLPVNVYPRHSTSIVASISQRCMAYLVDLCLVGFVYLSFIIAAALAKANDAVVVFIMLFPLGMFIYGTCMELACGSTLGKLVFGMYVRGKQKEKAEPWQIVLRNLVKLLGLLCLLPASEEMMLQEKWTSSVVCNKFK